jgi:hypothetical protein
MYWSGHLDSEADHPAYVWRLWEFHPFYILYGQYDDVAASDCTVPKQEMPFSSG